MADPTTSSLVRIRREQPGAAPLDVLAPVLLSIEALDGPPTIATAEPWDATDEYLDQVCPGNGECRRRYRLTALLIDPAAVDGEVRVAWAAVAEARSGTTERPAPVPDGATLTLTAGDPEPLDAAEVLTVSTAPQEQRLDVASPRVVQSVWLHRAPEVGGPGGPGLGVQLRVEGEDDPDRPGWQFRFEAGRARTGPNVDGTISAEMLPCEDPAGCIDELKVIGDWDGDDPAEAATVRWSVVATAFGRGDRESRPAPGSVMLEHDPPIVASRIDGATTTGELTTGGEEQSGRNVRVVVAGAVPAGAEGLLHVQPTLRATTSGPDVADGDVRISVGGANASGRPGADLVATARLLPLDCSQGRCQASFQIDASARQQPAGSVEIEWELSIALVNDVGVDLFGPDLVVDIEVTEPPR